MRHTRISIQDASDISSIANMHGIEHEMTLDDSENYVNFLFTTDFSRNSFIRLVHESGYELYHAPKSIRDTMIDSVMKGASASEVLDEALTNGIKNAMAKGKVKHKCSECGFSVPSYSGRYPNKCPECGAPLNKENGEGK